MEITKLQDDIVKIFDAYCEKNNIKQNKDFLLKKVFEEIGELTQAQIIFEKQSRKEKFESEEKAFENLEKEFADVVGLLFIFAKAYNIDVEKALINKWFVHKKEYKIL